jgi:hypothetical protein
MDTLPSGPRFATASSPVSRPPGHAAMAYAAMGSPTDSVRVTAGIRKIANGRVPSLLTISAIVLTLQTAAVIGTGELWIFLLQFPLANLCMCVLFARTARGPSR